MSDADWALILRSGHWDCPGWSRDGRDGMLVCACGVVLSEKDASVALVGPLRKVYYNTGPAVFADLPRNTLDIRYAACGNHHLACDCREAMLAEAISEYRMELRDIEQAIITATADHQVWGFDGTGWEDDFSACKCPVCEIRRACFVGYGEFTKARREASERLAAAEREREAAHFAAMYPDMDEVPF